MQIWRPDRDNKPDPKAFLLGDGFHGQAIVRENEKWVIRDRVTYPINNLENVLRSRARQSTILACYDDQRATDMNEDHDKVGRKRAIIDLTEELHGYDLFSEDGSTSEQRDKRTKLPQDTESTVELLAATVGEPTPYFPLPEDANSTNQGPPPSEEISDWVPHVTRYGPLPCCFHRQES